MPRPLRAALCAAAAAVVLAAAPARAQLPALKTEVAFPNLKFDRPVAMAYPAGSDRLFVVEQHQAKIYSFVNDPKTAEKSLFLTLPQPISKDNEEGLLGLAFHPKYAENGKFYVYYSAQEGPKNRRSVVAQFTRSQSDPLQADPGSEQRIWTGPDDPFGNHNGGCILFGPDGYLYITLGDSGAADDPLTTGQNPGDAFGSILRIDVDHPAAGQAYGIPGDNPRLRDPKTYAAWAPEVYAIGLRNVWKFSFDRAEGTLWAGDVGQNLWEMVYIITNGGNYGWSIKEGTHNFKARQKLAAGTTITPPVFEYPHSVGKSITGGYVYRGPSLPALAGTYVVGDFDSGRIWGVVGKDPKTAQTGELIDVAKNGKLNIAGFGEDAQGELYILAFDGRIHKLAPR